MALGIFVVSGWHDRIEMYYSNGLYPPLARTLRFLLGGIPFSLGDVLYAFVLLYILWELALWVRRLVTPGFSRAQKLRPLLLASIAVLVLYVYFYLFWGLNYYRLGIEHQLGLKNQRPPAAALTSLTAEMLENVNRTKAVCLGRQDTVMSQERLLESSHAAYRKLERRFPFLRHRQFSVKPSLFGKMGNYVGFQGYYNPFTGEAQINMRVPNFVLPFVTCHEMAHQLGYASESEANFVGFLAASHSTDTLMQYSAYFDMFLYAWNKLRQVDSAAAAALSQQLHPGAKRDLAYLHAFNRKYRSVLQDLTTTFYDYYLRQNRQRKGIDSYGEVTGWLIAFREKYGRF